jgi:hypothetical protein
VFKVPPAFLAVARHLPPAERAAREDVVSYGLSYTWGAAGLKRVMRDATIGEILIMWARRPR